VKSSETFSTMLNEPGQPWNEMMKKNKKQ